MDSYSFLIFLTVLNLPFDFAGAAGIVTTLGEDTELPCSVYTHRNVTELRWTRLDQDIRMLEYEKGKNIVINANYTERIYLRDPQLQRGNYSLILKNVTEEDNGAYECKAIFIDEQSAASETYSFSLRVVEPEIKGSGPPLKLFLPALMFSLLMGMILL